MCGRFALSADGATLQRLFSLDEAPILTPRYNIAPGTAIAIIRAEAGRRWLALHHWGLIPKWTDPDRSYKAINARAETLASKPYFRDALRRRRCLIPASGYYEWASRDRSRQPYYFSRPDGLPLAFAGIWESWRGQRAGMEQELLSCAIITTAASELAAAVHDRMPAILDPQDYGAWLEAGSAELLRPYPGKLQVHRVSRSVNDPRQEGPELTAAIAGN